MKLGMCIGGNVFNMHAQYWIATLKVKVTAWHWSKILSGPFFCYLRSDYKTIWHKWSPYRDDVSRTTFKSIPRMSRSQHDLAAKTCPAHNFVIWSRIFKLFDRNDHHIEMMCHYLDDRLILCVLYCIILSSVI